ncbi:tRNA (adenosine(37)-N6)-threonylcarbamoyltransferase complex transferase subunit TsaD [Candidatus Saccharibacteria bacterium]|nr:tRNA (adenosine(37)-N6)-threonylcarbamoyltransferase complex transferase subunit TsaD [Candidatus Saccharibacteria bacterium]
MKILGIETSCDETAAAVVENGKKILSNVVVSQIDIFAEYGGVIPEVAARSHLEVMMPVVEKAMKDAKCTWDDIDAIAVTYAPGLLGSLLIGTLTARTLAILHDKPLYAVHHLKSHVYANWLGDRSAISFPLLAMVISGGHTQILYMPEHDKFDIIGTTRDDAIGECFDKVAKILGLPYPGGPSIAKAAKNGDENKYKLPHPKIDGLDFSFSGLKTAVLRAVQKELGLPISHPSHDLKNHLSDKQVADFAASFEKTAIDILLEKLSEAKKQHPDAKSLVFAGGVSANQKLREKAEGAVFPEPKLSGDNGAMVAAAAYYEIQAGKQPTDPYKLNIYPRISIDA